MARPPEFDRSAALEIAMRLFWRQGYAATSLGQLLEETGLARSSFYATFGDKRSLFIEALRLFSDRTREMLVSAWKKDRSLDAVSRFFYGTLVEAPRYRSGRGCMMVNTILELADVDEDLCKLAELELARVEAVFEECFEEAQSRGTYSAERPASELAAHVMLLNQGFRVASRKRASRKELKAQIDTALSLLGLPVAV